MKNISKLVFLATVFVGTVTATAAPLRAQDVPVDTTFRVTSPLTPADSVLNARTAAVSAQLRCPVCQGESIEDSPSELSAQMRRVVKDQLRAGRTPDQVKAYFVSKYGEWILLDPEAHGFNLVLYAAPYVVLVAGVAVIVCAVRRWTRAARVNPGL